MGTEINARLRGEILGRLQALQGVNERIEKAQQDYTKVVASADANNKEFTLHWCAKGSPTDGLFASIVDTDNIIEFGLLERIDGEARNIIHVGCVLDDEGADILVSSDEDSELNYTAAITVDKRKPLDTALEFFERYL